MPLNIIDATKIVRENLPSGKIQKSVIFKNLYLFQVFFDNPYEGQYDPFYSVDKNTGEFMDFSVLGEDFKEISSLFEKANTTIW